MRRSSVAPARKAATSPSPTPKEKSKGFSSSPSFAALRRRRSATWPRLFTRPPCLQTKRRLAGSHFCPDGSTGARCGAIGRLGARIPARAMAMRNSGEASSAASTQPMVNRGVGRGSASRSAALTPTVCWIAPRLSKTPWTPFRSGRVTKEKRRPSSRRIRPARTFAVFSLRASERRRSRKPPRSSSASRSASGARRTGWRASGVARYALPERLRKAYRWKAVIPRSIPSPATARAKSRPSRAERRPTVARPSLNSDFISPSELRRDHKGTQSSARAGRSSFNPVAPLPAATLCTVKG